MTTIDIKLPVETPPNHTRRIVVWNDQKDPPGGKIFILVGYCPDTLPYFMGLLLDAQKAFPDIDLSSVEFGKVKNSRWCKGFTLLSAGIPGPKREIEKYEEHSWNTLDIGC